MFDDVTDSWLVGVVAHDEALSGLRVHGGLVAAGPASGWAHRAQVRLRYDGTESGGDGSPGFPNESGSRELLESEQALVDGLGTDVVLVAAVTVPGFRDLLFHTVEADRCRELLDAQGLGEVDVSADPSWSAYRALFADAVTADGDRRRVEDAVRMSGGGTPVCTVIHSFRFPDLAQADQAAAALREAGLTVTFAPAGEVAEAATPMFTVTETEALTQVEMARSRDALSGFATSWDGEYQGWTIG